MKRGTPKWVARYDALALRERWLVAVSVLAAIGVMGYGGLIDPALKRARAAELRTLEQQTQLASLRARGTDVRASLESRDAAALAELASLRNQLSELSGRLVVMERTLVPPQRMAGLLEDMIGRTGLALISLRTLPVVSLEVGKARADESLKAGQKPSADTAGLFKHGIEIKLEGSYRDLVVYLERLEQSKLKLLWSSVTLSAEKHPKLVLTLTVYTLSLDRTWLIV